MERYEQYIGKTLNGKYTIQELLGVGGMAYVFKATVIETGKTVSIKILNEESGKDEKSVTRFVNESKAVSMLSHQNIVKIYDVVIEKDINYLVMEYVDGITLKEYIDFKKKVEWGESVFYIRQILRALEHAHSTGIIHRDVKPQNIMITRDGVIKVMDFGIAKLLKSESITMTDMALGTVDYISPEQASGKKIGFYSDIYSVGVMLYEMTTGKLPFVAENTMAVAMKQIQDEPEPPKNVNPDIPDGLEQIILKSMKKEPDERFSSCASMEKALMMVAQDPTVIFTEHHKTTEKSVKSHEKKTKKSSFLAVISGVTLAFLIVLIASLCIFMGKFGSRFNFGTFNFKNESVEISIPDVTGEIFDESTIERFKQEGYEIEQSTKPVTYDPKLKVGAIISQSPSAGEKKNYDPKKLQKITVTVNPPPPVFVLDNYVNMNAQEIMSYLKQNGVDCKTVPEEHDTVIRDYIIRTEPGPGTVIEADKPMTITIYVSKGAPIIETEVPDVVGLTKQEAVRKLYKAGISLDSDIDYIEVDSEAPEGTVVDQSLEPGETAYRHVTRITLEISTGKVSSGDDPAEDEPAEDEPVVDEPAEDEPAEDDPAEDEPAEDDPAEDEPAEDKTLEENNGSDTNDEETAPEEENEPSEV